MEPSEGPGMRALGQFCTSDLSVASEALRRFYVPHDLHVTSRRQFELDSTMVNSGNVRVGQLTFGTDVEVACQADTGSYVLSYTTSGSIEVSSGQRQATAGPSRATLLAVGKSSRFDMPKDASLVTMSFERADLETELSTMLGCRIVRPIVFDFATDMGSEPGRSFLDTLELFRHQATCADTLSAAHPAFAAGLAKATITGLLLTFPHNYTDELVRGNDTAGLPPTIDRAVRAVEESPTTIHRADDLARLAGLSLRALEAGFERYVGQPPMAYVRRVRLDRARAQLLAGDAHSVNVSDVANRWGFSHLGRFSATYRATFGENPSATLLRTVNGLSAPGDLADRRPTLAQGSARGGGLPVALAKPLADQPIPARQSGATVLTSKSSSRSGWRSA